MAKDDLGERRREAAREEYEGYDFGDHEVVDQSGWEDVVPGRDLSRDVYVGPGEPTTRVRFVVRFAGDDSDVVESVEAYGGGGDPIGSRGRALATA